MPAPGRSPIVCDLGALPGGDLGTVDALARLALVARRNGFELRLRNPPAALGQLLVLCGLDAVLGVEAERQPEEREEHVGVEEERELADPTV